MLKGREVLVVVEKDGMPRGGGRRTCHERIKSSLGIATFVVVAAITSATTFAASANYTYDALGRLTKVVYTDGAKTSTITYTYDASGNRTSVVNTSPS
jgi:YD repeat-containing protein